MFLKTHNPEASGQCTRNSPKSKGNELRAHRQQSGRTGVHRRECCPGCGRRPQPHAALWGASPAPRPRGEARPREQDPTCAKFKTGTANPCRGRPAGTTRRERRGRLGCWGRAVTWVCSFCDSSLICALVTCALFYPCITGTSQKRRSADWTHQGTTK